MDIEKEVQARVEFKMNELLTAVENTAKNNWNSAFHSGNPKHAHYWEAFSQLKGMLSKEIKMSTPFDNMAKQDKRRKRNIAIEKIMGRFCKRGERDYHQKERLLVSIIEEAQR